MEACVEPGHPVFLLSNIFWGSIFILDKCAPSFLKIGFIPLENKKLVSLLIEIQISYWGRRSLNIDSLTLWTREVGFKRTNRGWFQKFRGNII
jgi:hypothetical protein